MITSPITELEKYAGTARKKQRLKDALRKSMKREATKGLIFKKTTHPLHPKTALIKAELEALEQGKKSAKGYARAKKLSTTGSPLARGLVSMMLPFAPVSTTVTGATVKADSAKKSGKVSKEVATAIRKVLTKGK